MLQKTGIENMYLQWQYIFVYNTVRIFASVESGIRVGKLRPLVLPD
jgi:hypothetical protein